MPRKKLKLSPETEDVLVDCFAFRLTKSGNPACIALNDVYCLKETTECAFKATPGEAAAAQLRAQLRLSKLRREHNL